MHSIAMRSWPRLFSNIPPNLVRALLSGLEINPSLTSLTFSVTLEEFMTLKKEGLITIRKLSQRIGGKRKTKLKPLRPKKEKTLRSEFLLQN